MSRYLRCVSGRTFFFTVVTHERRPILTTDLGRKSLRMAITAEQAVRPFDVVAIVLLPDHLHTVWELPADDRNFSLRWGRIKSQFTRHWLANGGEGGCTSASRDKRGEQAVWQRRFFEHTCRDEADLRRCVDYVHVNPLKHGLVSSVSEWPWSSFHRFVREQEYPLDWGNADVWYGDEWGE